MPSKTEYRVGVVGVFTNPKNQLLVGQRSDIAKAWQFPQGGVEPGESQLAALYREMEEEVGNANFEIIKVASRLVKYSYPPDVKEGGAKYYCGQTQQWFLLKFNKELGPNLDKSDSEFVEFAWRTPVEIVKGIVDWKRASYLEGLRMLGVEI